MAYRKGERELTHEQRFWARVEVGDDPQGCWVWTGGRGGRGARYGSTKREDRSTCGAHTFAYEQLVDQVPAGMHLDHVAGRCSSTLCVNPGHLEIVTCAENQRRRAEAQTHCRRANHPLSGDNLRINEDGSRACKACHVQAQRDYRSRKSARRLAVAA